jgi:hypothetical protein
MVGRHVVDVLAAEGHDVVGDVPSGVVNGNRTRPLTTMKG